jgi:anti-sigma factor (TIGR02949 family)
LNRDHISCEEVIEQLFDYLDREIDEDLSAVIDRHLEHCRDCFTRAEFERKLRAKVADSAEVKAPERLQRRIKGLLSEF